MKSSLVCGLVCQTGIYVREGTPTLGGTPTQRYPGQISSDQELYVFTIF